MSNTEQITIDTRCTTDEIARAWIDQFAPDFSSRWSDERQGYVFSNACPRCGGSGVYYSFGTCFKCDGAVSTGATRLVTAKKLVARERPKLRKKIARTAKAEERRQGRVALYAELLEANPWLPEVLAWDHPVCERMRASLRAWEGLTAAQVGFLDLVRKERASEVSAPSGRRTVTGTIKSTKYVNGFKGEVLKCLVTIPAEGGEWRAWGSVPAGWGSAYADAGYPCEDGISEWLVGRSVTFTANFEPKEAGGAFAFYKRPSKATIVAD